MKDFCYFKRILFSSLNLFLLFFQPLSAQRLGFNLTEGASQVKIPFEVHNNLIVIPVVLNNSLPLKFVLDTGVRNAILTEKVYADVLNLSYKRKISISGAGGENTIEAYVTNNISMDFPGVEGQGHAMLVLERDYLQLTSSLGTYVHGIIGYELFSRFIVRIDYSRRLMTLIEPKSFNPRKKFIPIPIQIEDTKPFICSEIQFDNQKTMEAKLLIDTGASHSLLLESESDERIKVPDKNIVAYLGRGLGGDIQGRIGRIKSLKISEKYTLKNVISSYPDKDSYADSIITSAHHRNGTIGGGILSRFSIYFDFPHERIFIKKNSDYRKPFSYNLSGMSVIVTGNKLENYEVVEVRESSPADLAGFQRGDRLLKINFNSTKAMNLNHVYNLLNKRANRRLRILIMRNGEKIQKKLYLKTSI